MSTIVVATSNPGKLKEFKDLFQEDKVLSLEDIGYHNEILETGNTFEENALIKAKQVSIDTGYVVLADDSGLEVDALGGAPGVYSARYSFERTVEGNNKKLIQELSGILNRSAQFVCVLCLYFPNGRYISARGVCKGSITYEPKGTNGFGYDPYFYLEEYQKTMAELPLSIKNQISHRAIAKQKLLEKIHEDFSA
ncbi:MAG: RdgB/HAM1 family non-canonical purine NTP pyrophosphatase [Anaeroplasmataceae bacterium]|nr:RdgB/HAM1 family non-canonical purine NTP pyrophosphatase [Anaeroplasmataceae bacterium]